MKLTKEQIDARVVVFDEVIGHLENDVYETQLEREQGLILQQQLIKLRDKFIETYYKCVG
jgi:hypothetical protein